MLIWWRNPRFESSWYKEIQLKYISVYGRFGNQLSHKWQVSISYTHTLGNNSHLSKRLSSMLRETYFPYVSRIILMYSLPGKVGGRKSEAINQAGFRNLLASENRVSLKYVLGPSLEHGSPINTINHTDINFSIYIRGRKSFGML